MHIKSRQPGSKGTEWLLIKHRDAYVQPGYDIDKYDYSVLTKRSLKEIAGDAGSAEWTSSKKVTGAGDVQQERLARRFDREGRCEKGARQQEDEQSVRLP